MAARHECGATIMADAYARMSDRLAVVTTAPGPRADQRDDRDRGGREEPDARCWCWPPTPRSAAVSSNFRIDQDAAVTAVGAVAERVHSPESAVADTVRAYRKAVHERRTVVLNLPLDVQAAPAAPRASRDLRCARNRSGPPPTRWRRWPSRCAAAQAPVFVAGRGRTARRAASCGRWPTRSARCSPPRPSRTACSRVDPWSLGISGGFASPRTARADRATPTWSSAGAAR